MAQTLGDRQDFERRQRVIERIAAALEHRAFVEIWRTYDAKLNPPVHKYNCAICTPEDIR